MIKLDIHEYCNECDGFEPVFIPGDKLYHDSAAEPIRMDSTVRCRYHKRCASIEKYLTKKLPCQS